MSQIEELRAFVLIVETGSLTQAADRMGIAVSAVSRRLRDLELGRVRSKEADPQAAGEALAKACLGEWFTPKSFDHSIRQLIRRLNWLCAARADLGFPPFDETAILNCLSAAFTGMTLAKQAVAADVKPAFRKHMPSEQWE